MTSLMSTQTTLLRPTKACVERRRGTRQQMLWMRKGSETNARVRRPGGPASHTRKNSLLSPPPLSLLPSLLSLLSLPPLTIPVEVGDGPNLIDTLDKFPWTRGFK